MNRIPGMSRWLLGAVGGAAVLALAGCGGEVEQREACVDYVVCVQARDAALGYETDVVRFDIGGACWGGVQGADLCETACIQGLEFLREREPGLPGECS
jgi:hypothetical protein